LLANIATVTIARFESDSVVADNALGIFSDSSTTLVSIETLDSSQDSSVSIRADEAELWALTNSLTPLKRNLILIAVSMGAMLHSMATTSVSVVLPQLQGSLSATPDQISWVITVAVIGSVIATPLSGWLVDRLGWRRVTLISSIGFSIATLLCASAESLETMLFARFFQGGFGAPMIPVAQAILLATFPDNERSWSQSAHGIATVLGQAMAPVIGAYFAATYDWRYAFLFLIPIAIASIAMTALWVPAGGRRQGTRLDWTAFIALSISITAFQLALDRGERLYWFESSLIVTYTIIAVVGFTVFLIRSLGHQNPFIDLSLFKNREFAIGTIIIILFGAISFLPNFLYPVILGNLLGYPETTIGAVLFIRGLGLLTGFFVVAWSASRYPRTTLLIGFASTGAAGVQGIFFSLNVQLHTVAVAAFAQGFGVALIWVPTIIAAFSTLSPVLLAQSSAVFHLLRQVAMSASLALMVGVTLRTGAITYSELSSQLNPSSPDMVEGGWNVESIEGIAALSAEIERQSQMVGYANAFVLYTLGCLLGAVLGLAVRARPRG
jgi:DHA2 family multidrug resistance protein